MFEDLEVANKEYEDLKVKYDELVVAKNGADEKIKTYEEGNKNYENEIQRLKIKKNKKELRQIENELKSNKYIDKEKAIDNKERLINQISDLDIMLYKLNKVHYRLKVCEKILNSELE